jgi:HEAT repeat protein
MKPALFGLFVLFIFAGCSRKVEITSEGLLKTLKEDQNPDMRGWAARELGRMPGKDAPAHVNGLTQALQDPHEDVRMAAAYGLADLGPESTSAAPALTKANQDSSARVRTAAAYALKEIQRKK